jgi:hypothetical protein
VQKISVDQCSVEINDKRQSISVSENDISIFMDINPFAIFISTSSWIRKKFVYKRCRNEAGLVQFAPFCLINPSGKNQLFILDRIDQLASTPIKERYAPFDIQQQRHPSNAMRYLPMQK